MMTSHRNNSLTMTPETAPWQPLYSRLTTVCPHIQDTSLGDDDPAPWHNHPSLNLARILVHRAKAACEQGDCLAQKMEGVTDRLAIATKYGQRDFLHLLWNDLATYQGVSAMHARYFADVALSADNILNVPRVSDSVSHH